MGRRLGSQKIDSRVRQARMAAGLSQQELAERTGLTRQAVNAIESGRYVPNTVVALHLARALGTRVERLFNVEQAPGDVPLPRLPEGLRRGDRVIAGRVGNRIVAHPAGTGHGGEGFDSASGIIADESNIRLFVPLEEIERTAFIVGCDPSLEMLATLVTRRSRGSARLVWVPGSSKDAIDALETESAHVGGIHLRDETTGEFNTSQATRVLDRTGGVLVSYADWEQGFVVRNGNPKRLGGVDALARRGVRIVNREPGAGSRLLLDGMLASACISPAKVAGYDRVVHSHMGVARAVAEGSADTGIAIRAVAYALGLDFVPLIEATFDLIIPSASLEHPAIDLLLELLQGAALRAELGSLPGYETGATGAVRATVGKTA